MCIGIVLTSRQLRRPRGQRQFELRTIALPICTESCLLLSQGIIGIRVISWFLVLKKQAYDSSGVVTCKAASGELGRAAALAIGWQQDAAGDSASVSGSRSGGSSQQGDVDTSAAGAGGEGCSAPWPDSRLQPLDPPVTVKCILIVPNIFRCGKYSRGWLLLILYLFTRSRSSFGTGRRCKVVPLTSKVSNLPACRAGHKPQRWLGGWAV